MALEKPVFVELDGQKILNETIAYYESLTGQTLPPAAPERLILNAFAYRELLARNGIQYTGEQNLVAFSNAPALDYLGELVGVVRLPASSATTTLRFTLASGHPGVVIAEGTRVQTTDQQIVFVTTKSLAVAAGVTTGDVDAEAETAGVAGNNYLSGTVSVILDPQAFVTAAANLATTDGGADEETDEQLRERIKLAPNAFSNAGSRQAYEFFARSAHPSIVDVFVTSLEPGNVTIYPLVEGGGTTSSEIIDAVFEACNAEKVRPITDTVNVVSPNSISYTITANLTLLNTASQDAVVANVTEQLQLLTEERIKKLGRDVLRNQVLSAILRVEGVYNAVLPAFNDIIVNNSSVAKCTSITVNVVGLSDG